MNEWLFFLQFQIMEDQSLVFTLNNTIEGIIGSLVDDYCQKHLINDITEEQIDSVIDRFQNIYNNCDMVKDMRSYIRSWIEENSDEDIYPQYHSDDPNDYNNHPVDNATGGKLIEGKSFTYSADNLIFANKKDSKLYYHQLTFNEKSLINQIIDEIGYIEDIHYTPNNISELNLYDRTKRFSDDASKPVYQLDLYFNRNHYEYVMFLTYTSTNSWTIKFVEVL